MIGAARTFNAAIKQLQLAALNGVPVDYINSFRADCCAFHPQHAKISEIPNSFTSIPLSAFGPQPLLAHLFEILHRDSNRSLPLDLGGFLGSVS